VCVFPPIELKEYKRTRKLKIVIGHSQSTSFSSFLSSTCSEATREREKKETSN